MRCRSGSDHNTPTAQRPRFIAAAHLTSDITSDVTSGITSDVTLDITLMMRGVTRIRSRPHMKRTRAALVIFRKQIKIFSCSKYFTRWGFRCFIWFFLDNIWSNLWLLDFYLLKEITNYWGRRDWVFFKLLKLSWNFNSLTEIKKIIISRMSFKQNVLIGFQLGGCGIQSNRASKLICRLFAYTDTISSILYMYMW